MTTYPFRQGIDYGSRKGTLGLAFHMAEGGDGTLAYLAKRSTETTAQWKVRVRGVSANAVILSTGAVWNMVDWDHASGSMNPNDRNPSTTGYYNGTVIKAVLGDKFVDPNAYSISVEICGYRAQGPTDAQVKAAIAWGLDMRRMFPTLRGAYGHHDQTDTKGCPGTTPNMKAIFEGVGGHGLFTEDDMGLELTDVKAQPGTATMIAAGPVWRVYNGERVDVNAGATWEATGTADYTVPSGASARGYMIRARAADGELHIVSQDRVSFVPAPVPAPLPPDAVSCMPFTAELQARIDAIKAEEVTHGQRVAAL